MPDWMIRESELDDDQIYVLDATLNRSCVVSGCAGSGKSILALVKAQRIQNEIGNGYTVIVYTKSLCRYMEAGKEALGLNGKFIYHWQWKNEMNCSSADYIIVDEIQDFTKEEIQEFIHAARRHFFFFGDTAQSLYNGLKEGGTMPVDDILKLFDIKGSKSFSLYRNYRLPLPVAELVQYVGIELEPFDKRIYKSKETEMPRILQYDNYNSQIQAIIRIIKNKNLTDVAILLPTNDGVKSMYNTLRDKGLNCEVKYNNKDLHNSVDTLDFNSENPKIMTYHSAKGLQFEAVFMPNVALPRDGTEIDKQKALYVAMTRTWRYLYIMYSGELPSVLQGIPEDLYKKGESEEVEDI
jgi:superfamily I DNA/RNA helicase